MQKQEAFQPYIEERLERMRRVRVTARFAVTLRAEFGEAARLRRQRAGKRMLVDKMLSAVTAAAVGPDRLPAVAFDQATIDGLLAPWFNVNPPSCPLWGCAVPAETEIRVWDTTADTRFMVLPMRPPETAGWPEDKLASIVTRDSLISVARLSVAGGWLWMVCTTSAGARAFSEDLWPSGADAAVIHVAVFQSYLEAVA